MTQYRGSGAVYVEQLLRGVAVLTEFSKYAEGLGCRILDGSIDCTTYQAVLLDAWWVKRMKTDEPERERCNCGASCGENRYHDKGGPGCRYAPAPLTQEQRVAAVAHEVAQRFDGLGGGDVIEIWKEVQRKIT